MRQVKTRLHEHAQEETTALPITYDQKTTVLAHLPSATAMMPTFVQVSSTLCADIEEEI